MTNLCVRDNRHAKIPFHSMKKVIEARMHHNNFHLEILIDENKSNQLVAKVNFSIISYESDLYMYTICNFIVRVITGPKQLLYQQSFESHCDQK